MQKHTYDPDGKARRSPDNGEPYLFCRIIVQIYKKYLPVSNIAPSICLQHTKKNSNLSKKQLFKSYIQLLKSQNIRFCQKKTL